MSGLIAACLGVAFVAAVFFVVGPDRKARKRLVEQLAGRPRREDEEYFNEFFEGSEVPREVVSKIRAIFNEQLGMDLGALGADDDLSGDFSTVWSLDSMADVEILVAVESEFGIEISDEEAAGTKSLRALAELVAVKLRGKNP